MFLNESVSVLKNVGKKRLDRLRALNIHTVSDLLAHYPRDYRDLTVITPVSGIVSGGINVIRVKIISECEILNIRGLLIIKTRAADATGEVELAWFNQPYLKNQFAVGKEYIFYGKASYKFNRISMDAPEYEPIDGRVLLSGGRIAPVYPLTAGISKKMFLSLMKEALDRSLGEIAETLPGRVLEKYGLCGKGCAVSNIHFPESADAFHAARRRLVFNELFDIQLILFNIKGVIKKRAALPFADLDAGEFTRSLPFALTRDQSKTLGEITGDMRSGRCMNRLLQGDVGSGKTAVAMAAAWLAIKNGYQAAVMAPTEVLAKQHFNSFSSAFARFGIKVVLLTGSAAPAEKDAALGMTASGEARMIVGTHAVIQERVEFNDLALAITDEQHRFGVRQRTVLNEKSPAPHALVMTATPIPRTLALILYGDLDISTIRSSPPGRQKIDTFAVDSGYSERIYAFIKKEIENGRQAYIICPVIDENEDPDIKSAVKYAERLRETRFGGGLAVLHGKMNRRDKDAVMDGFVSGEISVIVSTTVIEVGVDVPNATVMLIENADRFGLSQLHQLRGRVGRGEHKSYCILVSDNPSENAKSRLNAMVKTSDGFEISRLDLALRGPGDFFGTRQHGLPEMRIANLYTDADILAEAQEAAREIYESDPAYAGSVPEWDVAL